MSQRWLLKGRKWSLLDIQAVSVALVLLSGCLEADDLTECNYHYLIPDDPPYTGIVSSYNFPFRYLNGMNCNYRIHLPSHLAKEPHKYQLCFTFYRFELENCYDKLRISDDTFCGNGQRDPPRQDNPERNIWTEPLCYNVAKDGNTLSGEAYLEMNFYSDMHDVRGGFYAQYNLTSLDVMETNNESCNSTSPNEFRCFDRSCIPLPARCNGISDCPDYSDETFMHGGCQGPAEVPGRDGWVCNFDTGGGSPRVCNNFRLNGWQRYSPRARRADTEYVPDVDHTTGESDGWFLTADFTQHTSGSADATFPTKLGDEYYCLSFWYQMRGQHVGRLNVFWGSPSEGVPIWTRNGTTGHRWQRAQITIYKPSTKDGEIVFRATRERSIRSKISIDDFKLLSGHCQFLDDITCNFETENVGTESGTCGWEMYNNVYDWTQGSDQWKLVPANTIDNYAVFPDRSPGNKVLRYTLDTNKPAAAFLRSPVVSQGQKYSFQLGKTPEYQTKCFSMWFYSTSKDLSLKYYANYGNSLEWNRVQPFHTRHVEADDIWTWTRVRVDLPNNDKPFRIILLVGYDDHPSEHTIAFDEFTLVGESCSYLETLTCPPGYFGCKTGLCILERDRCDGYFNCKDQSDESKEWAGCDYGEKCHDSYFHCATELNTCFPQSWVCDGTQDCNDRSDERGCPGEHRVPPAAIGAICAASSIVVCFIGFKLVYGLWRSRRDERLSSRTGGSSREPEEDFDPEVFQPPPTYAQCVSNPAHIPVQGFKPPDAPFGSSRSVPPPPAYHRILSGEFKELTVAELTRMDRASNSQDSAEVRVPRELRPNRFRPGSASVMVGEPRLQASQPRQTHQSLDNYESHNTDMSHPTGRAIGLVAFQNTLVPPEERNQTPPHHQPIFGGQTNAAFTDDEYNDILSIMQGNEETNPSHNQNMLHTSEEINSTAVPSFSPDRGASSTYSIPPVPESGVGTSVNTKISVVPTADDFEEVMLTQGATNHGFQFQDFADMNETIV